MRFYCPVCDLMIEIPRDDDTEELVWPNCTECDRMMIRYPQPQPEREEYEI